MRRQKTYPKGRVCESEGCSTILSIYNDDSACAACWEAIPVEDLAKAILAGTA